MAEKEFNDQYGKCSIYCVFFLVFFCSLNVNFDHGALPSCTEEVKQKMMTNNFGFGALGTAVYIGVTIGCLLSSYLLSLTGSKKKILVSYMFINVISLFAFTFIRNIILAIILRIFTGLF